MPNKNQTTSSTPAPKKARRGRKKNPVKPSEVVATATVEAAAPPAVDDAMVGGLQLVPDLEAKHSP